MVRAAMSSQTDVNPTTDNYRIDLDNLHSAPSYGIDVENSSFEHYAIDLDSFNAL
jgi:hypothetical protein